MRAHIFIALFLTLTLRLNAEEPAKPEKKPEDTPIKRAEKPTSSGVELFSWFVKGEEAWRFALLPAPGATDPLKTALEVASKENTLEGVDALKKKLAALAIGEKVGWFNMLEKKSPRPEDTFFDYPPKDVVKDLELYCTVLKIRLNIYQASLKKQ